MITGTSVDSVVIGTGDKSFTTQAALLFAVGQLVTIVSAIKPVGGAALYWMAGTVKSYDPVSGAIVITVTSLNGSGTFAAWVITVYAAHILDLTTVADAIAYLPEMMAAPPLLIQRLVTAASSFLQTHLNRVFLSQGYSESRDGNGSNLLLFYSYPVTAVNSVVVDGITVGPFATDPTPGYIFSATALYLRNAIFSRDIRNVYLAYTAGYAEIPFEIAQITIDLVALKFKQRERVGVTGVGLGPERISYTGSDVTDEFKSLLRQYQKVVPV